MHDDLLHDVRPGVDWQIRKYFNIPINFYYDHNWTELYSFELIMV